MKKKDFSDKNDWTTYKSEKSDLSAAQKAFDTTNDAYINTLKAIDEYKRVEPEMFKYYNNYKIKMVIA